VKHLMRYIKGTVYMKLTYSPPICILMSPLCPTLMRTMEVTLTQGDRLRAICCGIGTGAVSWSSKLQSIVALSTTEAEFVAAVEAGKEIVWMQHLLQELGYQGEAAICVQDQ